MTSHVEKSMTKKKTPPPSKHKRKITVTMSIDPDIWHEAKKIYGSVGISISQFFEMVLGRSLMTAKDMKSQMELFSDDLAAMSTLIKPKKKRGRPKKNQEVADKKV
jgi:antitoxin component of RelBE/YafQ-DinJ toxin-antitoxin module